MEQLSDMINKISTDPSKLDDVLNSSITQMTPEVMEQAKNFMNAENREKIMQQFSNSGLNAPSVRGQMIQQLNSLKGLQSKSSSTKQIIIITNARKLKTRNISINSSTSSIAAILKIPDPVQLSCSRLATGSLSNKTINVWYNPNSPGKNKRLSKILGFDAGGEAIIICEEGDLTEQAFINAESSLA